MSVKQIVGENIRNNRIRIGLSQVELAACLGYTSTGTLSNIENGNRGLDMEKIPEVCLILGITPTDLFTEA